MNENDRLAITHRPTWGHYKPPFSPFLPNQGLDATNDDHDATPFVCVKINRNWIPFIIGALETLTDERIYNPVENDPGLMIARVPDLISSIINGNMPCGDESMLLRQNPNSNCLLEQSNDGGQTWSLAFDYSKCQSQSRSYSLTINQINQAFTDINTDFTIYNGDIINVAPGWEYKEESATLHDQALCWALKLYIDLVCEMAFIAAQQAYENELDILGAIERTMAKISEMLIEAASFNIFIPELLAAASAAAAAAVLTALYAEFVSAPPDTSIFQDETAKTEARCWAYCELKGATPTFDAWHNVWYPTSLTGNAEYIAATAALVASDEEFFVEFLKLVHGATELEDDGVLPCPCDCPTTTWHHDIILGNTLPSEVTLIDGYWVENVGIHSTDRMLEPSRYYRFAIIRVTLPAARKVTKIKLHFARYFGTWYNSALASEWIQCEPSMEVFPRAQSAAPAGDTCWWQCVPNDALLTTAAMQVSACRETHNHYSGTLLLLRLELWGEGDNPFT
jgi:hypothetical protein